MKRSTAALIFTIISFILLIICELSSLPFSTGYYTRKFSLLESAHLSNIIAAIIIAFSIPKKRIEAFRSGSVKQYTHIAITIVTATILTFFFPPYGFHDCGAEALQKIRIWLIFGAAISSGIVTTATRFGTVNGLILLILVRSFHNSFGGIFELFSRGVFTGETGVIATLIMNNLMIIIFLFALFYSFKKTDISLTGGNRKILLPFKLNLLGVAPIYIAPIIMMLFNNLINRNSFFRTHIAHLFAISTPLYLFMFGALIFIISIITIPLWYSPRELKRVASIWGYEVESGGAVTAQIWLRGVINGALLVHFGILPFLLIKFTNTGLFLSYISVSLFAVAILSIAAQIKKRNYKESLKVLASFTTTLEAELCADFLQNKGIIAVVNDNRGTAALGTLSFCGTVPPLFPALGRLSLFGGEVTVSVEESERDSALELISSKV